MLSLTSGPFDWDELAVDLARETAMEVMRRREAGQAIEASDLMIEQTYLALLGARAQAREVGLLLAAAVRSFGHEGAMLLSRASLESIRETPRFSSVALPDGSSVISLVDPDPL
jgi:hypothetical protein